MVSNARDPCTHGPFGASVCVPFRACMLVQMGAIPLAPSGEDPVP
jgi:hypothetical protein